MSYPSCLRFSCYIFIFLWAFNMYSLTAGLPWIFPPSKAELKPDDPVVEEGDTLVLNCTLTERYNNTWNASSLAFKVQGQRLGPEYVSVLSDDTVQLRLPNVTSQRFGIVFCYMLPNRYLGINAVQAVHVTRRPIKPVQECRVYNWQRLECSWTPSSEEQKRHVLSKFLTSEVFWHIQGVESNVCHSSSKKDSFNLQRNVTSLNVTSLNVTSLNVTSLNSRTGGDGLCVFQMGQSYCFQVEVTNILMKPVRSDQVCFNTSDIVWPNPPEALSGSLSDDGKSILVQWKPPSSSFRYDPLQLTYSLAYKSQWDQSNTSRGDLNAVSSVTLPGNPYTKYTVWLKVKTLNSGFWSNETKFEFNTPERAPHQQPVLNRRGFSIFSDDGVSRKAAIYWKPVSMEMFSGPGFHYIASVKSSEIWEMLNDQKTTDSFLEIPLKPDATDVQIIAQNDVGNCTAPQETIHIPSISSGSPVFEVIVKIDAKIPLSALIHWTYVSEPADWNGVTIFWCSSPLLFTDYAYCEHNVYWKELTLLQQKQQQYNLSLDNSLHPMPETEILRVGVSVDVNGIPSGIKWSNNLYAPDEVAPPPEDVQVDGSDDGSVYMMWKKPKCFTNSPCGYADEFLLVYCLVSSVDNEDCVDKNYSVRISSQKFVYSLTGLESGSNYKLWMLSHSKVGFSSKSNTVYAATPKSWKTTGAIVGIAFGSIIVLTVILFGVYSTCRFCKKYMKQLQVTRCVEMVIPKTVSLQRESTSSETQILCDNMGV